MSAPPVAELAALLAVLAHDLRNPLSALLTNVNFARGAGRGRALELDAALSDASLSCALLGHLIGNIDVLSAVLAELPPVRRAVSARDLANEAVARAAPVAALVGVSIEMIAPDPCPVLLLDPIFAARALDNVLANAIQFSPPRGAVRLSCLSEGELVTIVVSDDGPIIPPALRASVLTAAGQHVAKSSWGARYGRGLGLYCAAEAARMGGAELVAGERDGRAAFTLSAPPAAGNP